LALEGDLQPVKEGQENTVFISYASEDFDAARRLYNDLKNVGLNPWLDKESILPGLNWEIEIRSAIKNSRYFLSLNSLSSVQKIGVVQKESKICIGRQENFPESAVFIIPVRLDDCQLAYEKLEKIQYVVCADWDIGLP
jgi:hypothetical protein